MKLIGVIKNHILSSIFKILFINFIIIAPLAFSKIASCIVSGYHFIDNHAILRIKYYPKHSEIIIISIDWINNNMQLQQVQNKMLDFKIPDCPRTKEIPVFSPLM